MKLSLQTVLDRVREHGWSFADVELAIRRFNLPPIGTWGEAEWYALELVLS